MVLLRKFWLHQLLLLLLLVMGLWLFVVPAKAAINDQIHFQGKVVNSDGTNVTNNDYSFTFTIYDAATDGTNLWTETKTITVTDGIFATDLGSVTDLPGSIDFNTDSLYLGVNFNSDGEMSPRIRLTAVPYAFNAEMVNGLTVTDTDGTLTIPNSTIAFSGDNDVTFTSTGATTLTLPTTGTLATLAGAETFSNKTIASGGLTVVSTGWVGVGSSAGRVVFTDATTDTITFLDANVGIGSTAPTQKLDVQGNIMLNNNNLLSADSISISDPGPGEGLLFNSTAATWRIDVSNLARANGDGNLNLYGTADNIALWRPSLWVYDASNYTTATAQSTGGLNFTSTGGHITFNPSANVGIGTTSPGARLSVVNATGNANVAEFIGQRDANNINIYFKHNSTASVSNSARMTFQLNTTTQTRTAFEFISGFADVTDATRTSITHFASADGGSYGNRMTLYGGSLGIGIETPTARLDVNGTASTSATLSFRGTTDPKINILNGETFGIQTSVGGDGGLIERFTVLNNGNIGIGTTYPLAKLHIQDATNPGIITLDSTNSVTTFLQSLDTAGIIGTSSNHPLAILTNSQSRMTFDTAGNVGIGTAVPNTTLDLAGFMAAPGATLSAKYAGGTALTLKAGPSATADILRWQNSSSSTLGVIDESGNIGIGSVNPARLLNVAGAIRLNSASQPSSPALGDVYTNADGNLYFYNGSTWDDLTSGGGGTSYWAKSGTNLSPVTSGDDVYLASGELLGVGYDPTALSGAVAAFSGNIGIGTSTADSKVEILSGDTTRALQVIGDSVTTGEVIDISADGLSTGYAFNLSSTSTSLSTGGLIDLDWTPGSSTTATGDLFRINVGANGILTGNVLALYNNSNSLFLVGTSSITSSVPHEFTATGDVGIAHDLVFSNQTASVIESYGPLTIKSGEVFENLDLTLDPSGTGGVVIAQGANIKMYSDQELIFDVDDGSDSYIQFDSTNNRVEIFADGSERFRFTASGNNESNGTITTTLSDLAENYPTMNENLQPGDVIMIADSTENAPAANLVDTANAENRQHILGVVSSRPGIVLGGSSFLSDICEAVSASQSGALAMKRELLLEEYQHQQAVSNSTDSAVLGQRTLNINNLESLLPETTLKTIEDRLNSCNSVKQVPVALAGRVPVKFDASKGTVKPGDLLSISNVKPGHASKATTSGWVLGRALESSNSDSETVMMFVNVTWYGGNDQLSSLSQIQQDTQLTADNTVSDLLSTATSNGKQFLVSSANLSIFGAMTAEKVVALDSISTGMLTISGANNEITTLNGSTLKLQTGFGAGNIEAFNKKLIFTAEGGVIAEDLISAKRFAGSEDSRGSVYATSNRVRVDKNWKTAPASITLTSEYRADVWVSDISKDGFYINAEPVSANKKIFWWAVW